METIKRRISGDKGCKRLAQGGRVWAPAFLFVRWRKPSGRIGGESLSGPGETIHSLLTLKLSDND